MSTTEQLVTGIDFVAVPTGNLEVAVEFYGEVLGLPHSVYNVLMLHHRYAPR